MSETILSIEKTIQYDKQMLTRQGTVALWSNASVLDREDGGSNLGLGIFILLTCETKQRRGGTKIGPA